MIPLFYFVSSLAIAASIFFTLRGRSTSCKIMLVCAGLLYSIFCFVAYGKMSGLIPTVPVAEIVRQKGFDESSLPISVDAIMQCGFLLGIILNLATVVWISFRRGFWGWCLLVAAIFCICGAVSGPVVGVSPVFSLFGLCCGAMAGVGWVLGLTYIEFCVIGNIWVPCIGLIAGSIYLLYSSIKGMGRHPFLSALGILFGIVEIIVMVALLWHYSGTMNYTFYQCVKDLGSLAAIFGTTYEVVNLVVYVIASVALLSIDIVAGKYMLSTKSLPSAFHTAPRRQPQDPS